MPAQAVFVRANHNANSDENQCGCVPRFAGGWSGFAATWAQAAELINAVAQNKSIVAWMRLETWVGGLIGGGLAGSKAGKTADLLFNVVGYDQIGNKNNAQLPLHQPQTGQQAQDRAAHVHRPGQHRQLAAAASTRQCVDADIGFRSTQNSIPFWAFTPCSLKGWRTSFISVTRSARSSNPGGAPRPVRATWVSGGRRARPSSSCSSSR